MTNWGIDICKKRVIISVGRLAYNSDKVYLISKVSRPGNRTNFLKYQNRIGYTNEQTFYQGGEIGQKL